MANQRPNKKKPAEGYSKFSLPSFRVLNTKFREQKSVFMIHGLMNQQDHLTIMNLKKIIHLLEISKKEKTELEKELKHLEDNAPRKKEILYLLKRMKNQETTKKLLDKQKQERLQKQNEIMEAAKEGKKPYIPKMKSSIHRKDSLWTGLQE
ncbi:hypothetical protein CEXT_590061 [Caerostris extrusa]|uniref:Uncharacterized protein n=1 Tax=Caerostris extrusa TaxID=172846 RepID=A0AAV4QY57_CAEEX|nr:hypothetical protein CEXT_590061 [Caerostris extrusa]